MLYVDPSGEVVETVWDIGNIAYDIGRGVKNVGEIIGGAISYGVGTVKGDEYLKESSSKGLKSDIKDLGEVGLDVGTDALATIVPFVPAGGSKITREVDEVVKWSSISKPDLTKIESKKLNSIVNRNYRENAEYGNGSTADAIRYTKSTGNLIKGSDHIQKGNDTIKGLNNLLKSGNLNEYEKTVSNNIINDLKDALK